MPVFLPDRSFTTDNAAMIAWAGVVGARRGAAHGSRRRGGPLAVAAGRLKRLLYHPAVRQ